MTVIVELNRGAVEAIGLVGLEEPLFVSADAIPVVVHQVLNVSPQSIEVCSEQKLRVCHIQSILASWQLVEEHSLSQNLASKQLIEVLSLILVIEVLFVVFEHVDLAYRQSSIVQIECYSVVADVLELKSM